jgi:DNA-binding NarL/FixJ family response regulator
MGARIRIFLTPEENRTLFELRTATTVPQRVKDRAEALRFSAHGWYVEKIADYLDWAPKTVRETIYCSS